MLQRTSEIQCGVFDSELLRRGERKSDERRVILFELELFLQPQGASYVDGVRYPIRRGMLLCAKPGQKRHSDFPLSCRFIRIVPDKDSDIDAALRAAPDCFYIDDEGAVLELLGLYTKLASLCIGSEAHVWDTAHANATLHEILWRCMRLWQRDEAATAGADVSRLTREAYEYINEHFTERCTLGDIAAVLHVSPNYLHALFKRETGKTPLAHVQHKRVEKAKKLILAGESSMLEIAMETGFSSQSHFNKVFKALVGQTPVLWRQSLIKSY